MGQAEDAERVEVRRSDRRRRTVSAYREGRRIVVLIPASFSDADEAEWVATMVRRIERAETRGSLTEDDLRKRALQLSNAYLGGLVTPETVRWAANQHSRWGSCTPADGAIRLSQRLQGMPSWVLDYVLVHELAHFLEPRHDPAFWAWVDRYPKSRKAQGYLLGWSEAARVKPPSEFDD